MGIENKTMQCCVEEKTVEIKEHTLRKETQQAIDDVVSNIYKKDKETDVFITALRMAINNDGEIDKKELKHLLKLERKSSRQSKNLDDFWQPLRLEIDFGNWFSLPRMRFFSTPRDNNYFEKSNLDQGLREAFILAALDGIINSNEIKELKLHL